MHDPAHSRKPLQPAILYKRDGYSTQGKRLLGRHSAGEGFLKGLARYSQAETLFGYTTTQTEFTEFSQNIQTWAPQRWHTLKWIPENIPSQLAESGLLYRPDSMITPLAWQRRFGDQRCYSVCGVTHTIASKETLREIADFLLAPLQPWDALICTSQAVKTAVMMTLEAWGDYLENRIGKQPEQLVQLPVIPLGIDCQPLVQAGQDSKHRQKFRQRLGIHPDDVVILFVGRLIFYAKAHPVPMYLAMEAAAQATTAKIHLVQAGWFENQREEDDFQQSAQQFCPSVIVHFVDGRQPEIRQQIWSLADIFISLADNIQETFGLTPIEAMASGLPVIVSDWNGYQESVRDGLDGFRIPTWTPPPGAGFNLNAQYCSDVLNYSTYVGHVAIATAVDIKACTEALVKLIQNPDLRKQMGMAGQRHAISTFDWQVVIAAYESLWYELAEIRNIEKMMAPVRDHAFPYPLCIEPFQLFSHYPTQQLSPEVKLQLSSLATPQHLDHIRQTWSSNFGASYRIPWEAINTLLYQISQSQTLTVGDILALLSGFTSETVMLTLGYLLKFQILEIYLITG